MRVAYPPVGVVLNPRGFAAEPVMASRVAERAWRVDRRGTGPLAVAVSTATDAHQRLTMRAAPPSTLMLS
jgi:hypothetical protein